MPLTPLLLSVYMRLHRFLTSPNETLKHMCVRVPIWIFVFSIPYLTTIVFTTAPVTRGCASVTMRVHEAAGARVQPRIGMRGHDYVAFVPSVRWEDSRANE